MDIPVAEVAVAAVVEAAVGVSAGVHGSSTMHSS